MSDASKIRSWNPRLFEQYTDSYLVAGYEYLRGYYSSSPENTPAFYGALLAALERKDPHWWPGTEPARVEPTLEDGKYYWIRTPIRRHTPSGTWEDALSDWQPASYEDGCLLLIGDRDICKGRPEFAKIVVHPVPMLEPPT